MAMAALRRVDISSGQAYTETVSAPPSLFSNGPAWIHESPFLPSGWEEASPYGASSLMHLAMRRLLSDQRGLTPSLFANVPWRVANYLWDCLGRSKKRTLHMWKLFATAYPQQFPKVERYHSIKIEGPKASMREYLGLANSDSLSWRVVLTLAASYARVPELVGVAHIKNLVALEIATPSHLAIPPETTDVPVTALTDRIVRAWSELAQTSEAFQHFQVLVLRQQRELSNVALGYLRALPALEHIVAYECPGITSADSGGGVNGWTIVEVKSPPPNTLYELYQACAEASSADRLSLRGSPILDFQIGQTTSQSSKKIRKKSGNRTNSIATIYYLQRTGLEGQQADREPGTKKRKGLQDNGNEAKPQRPRKAVMRGSTKDIGDMLRDFF
ncbi:uncharacterized protein BJX67DRAFT_325386 [Aspergillus lucknowensis]|uniref:Cbs domain-containing protein n=1 Tax=Aspergillus lucknowensis TaxID=176173 RepID=A0ABR4L8M8_9EURO